MRKVLLRPIRALQLGHLTTNDRSSRRRFSSDSYYDSQSGLLLPKHNEKLISVFLDISKETVGRGTRIPAQLYKETRSDIPENLQALQETGVTGLWLPPAQFPRDLRNIKTLHHVAPPGFRFFVAFAGIPPNDLCTLSIMHEFHADEVTFDVQKSLKYNIQNGFHATLRLGESVWADCDAVSVASRVAALIDKTGGVDCIWITPSQSADADDVTQWCEELMYLDVAGPTIKSRIIIDSVQEEIIDETMLIGINKFVVKDHFQIDTVDEIAKAQNKELRRN